MLSFGWRFGGKILPVRMQPIEKNKASKAVFKSFERTLTLVTWILLIVAIFILFVDGINRNLHDLALSYISGMIVYVLTVVIPGILKHIRLQRFVINELALLYLEYKDLLRTISGEKTEDDIFSIELIEKGLERFNCRKQSDCICLSNRMVDILKPKCAKILSITSLLLSKHYAFTVEELLVIHEITQVWFLKDISSLDANSDYFQRKTQMMNKAEYLVNRYNDLKTLYFTVKRKTKYTIGWHPD